MFSGGTLSPNFWEHLSVSLLTRSFPLPGPPSLPSFLSRGKEEQAVLYSDNLLNLVGSEIARFPEARNKPNEPSTRPRGDKRKAEGQVAERNR